MPPSKDAAAPKQKMLTASFTWAKDANGIFYDIFCGHLILDHVCAVM